MGFCRAFFGDLNDWLHQRHHFSFEPSGISKTKVLFQVVSVIQVAENVYLPLRDEQNDFVVKTFSGVKTRPEFLEKLKKENIERMRGCGIEEVLSTLTKPAGIPFYFSRPIKRLDSKKSDADLKTLDKIFKDNVTGITIVLITESDGTKETEVGATDGCQATSLLLFVHPKNQPESEEAESLDQQTTLRSAKETGASNSGPSISSSKDTSFGSRVKVFEKRSIQSEWAVERTPSLHKFLRGAKFVLMQTSDAEKFKARESEWQVVLAHLLKKCAEEIEGGNLQFNSLTAFGAQWTHLKEIFTYYLQKNSETIKSSKPEGPFFLRPSFTFCYQGSDYILGWILNNVKSVGDILGVPPEETVFVACPFPDCQEIVTLANLALHKLNKHRTDVLKSLACPFCQRRYEKEPCLRTHLNRDEGFSFRTGQKRKPEESSSPVCATPKAKRTSQVKSLSSHQLSYPSVLPPKDQYSELYGLLESVTDTTSYNSSMPYSDHLNPAHGYHEENSRVPSPKSTDLPNFLDQDFTSEDVDDARMDEFVRSVTEC